MSKIAVGAPLNDGNGLSSGNVSVYDMSQELLSLNHFSFIENAILLYPNPASKMMRVKLNENLRIEKIKIYNNLGQLMLTLFDETIDISELVSGTYYVAIITNTGVTTKQLVIKE